MLKRRIATIALAAGLLLGGPAQASRSTPQYTSLTVFGDSLVDAGNYFINTNGGYPDAASGYFMGRNTNGYDYTDLLSLKLFGTPTVASLAGGSNYGLGGAHTYEAAGQIGQYEQHLTETAGSVDPNGLVVVNFGGNDVFLADGLSPSDRDQYLRFAAQTYANAVQELNDLGVRNLLVAGFPNPMSASASAADEYLKSDLAALRLGADTSLFQYSLTDFFNSALTNPSSVGLPPLQNATSCIAAHAQADCSGYFSFDGIHPTAAVDQALFNDMDSHLGLTAVTSVPEPATWAMMLIGLGSVGAALRGRTKKPDEAALA